MSKATEPTFGTAEAGETDEFLSVMCDAFGMEPDAARPIFTSDPYFDLRNKYVLRLGGSIVSCLTVVERACWIGDAIVKVAGIAGVATRNSHRRRGLAARLMLETIGALTVRGFHLSALFPVEYEYYRRLGWAAAGSQHTAVTIGSRSKPVQKPLAVRPANSGDIPVLSLLYTAAARARTMHCLRDSTRWNYLLTYLPESCVAWDPSGSVVAYALCDAAETRSDSSSADAPLNADANRLRVLEIVGNSTAASRSLRETLQTQDASRYVEFSGDRDDLVNMGLTPPFASAPGLMVRIVDVGKLIEALSVNWNAASGTLGIALTDPIGFAPPQAAVIHLNCGEVSVELIDPAALKSRTQDYLVGGIGEWSAVAVGHLDAGAACRSGALRASTSNAAHLAATLFPATEPYMPVADHF